MNAILVLSDVGDETWGAVLEDGEVVELHVENAGRPGIAGNIYKGRVSRVLPGMQSAFVDIGIERSAFLHVADLALERPEALPFETPDDDAHASAAGMECAENAPRSRPEGPIQDRLREGQELIVQVAKEPIDAKGARVTAQVALPGRALVHLPLIDRVLISRRIEDADERERLKALMEGIAVRGSGGWIVRTAAERCTPGDLERDGAYLLRTWTDVRQKEGRMAAPALLHADLGLAERLLRDVITDEFSEVIVDSPRLHAAAIRFLELSAPRSLPRLRLVSDGWSLFDEMGIHLAIERSSRSRIWLKTGGSIVVNSTEALVVIDVNTGRFVGSHDLEDTALVTNLEAVREIVRQLRLRDLGGIIVIDFIDMTQAANREALSCALFEELRKDRSRTKLLAMSDFGLVQLTRKRTRRSLDRALQTPCPTCGGEGRIRSAMALYYGIQRDLARGAGLAGTDGPTVRMHPSAAQRLDHEGLRLRLPHDGGATAGQIFRAVRLAGDASLSEEDYAIDW